MRARTVRTITSSSVTKQKPNMEMKEGCVNEMHVRSKVSTMPREERGRDGVTHQASGEVDANGTPVFAEMQVEGGKGVKADPSRVVV